MGRLDDLLDIEGVVAVGEFTADGGAGIYKSKMDMPTDMDRETSQFAALVSMLYKTLASAYSELYKMDWLPQRFWTYSGGDWTVAVGENTWVFIETAKVDFNKLYAAFGLCP